MITEHSDRTAARSLHHAAATHVTCMQTAKCIPALASLANSCAGKMFPEDQNASAVRQSPDRATPDSIHRGRYTNCIAAAGSVVRVIVQPHVLGPRGYDLGPCCKEAVPFTFLTNVEQRMRVVLCLDSRPVPAILHNNVHQRNQAKCSYARCTISSDDH